jgi:hypothetical protein
LEETWTIKGLVIVGDVWMLIVCVVVGGFRDLNRCRRKEGRPMANIYFNVVRCCALVCERKR